MTVAARANCAAKKYIMSTRNRARCRALPPRRRFRRRQNPPAGIGLSLDARPKSFATFVKVTHVVEINAVERGSPTTVLCIGGSNSTIRAIYG